MVHWEAQGKTFIITGGASGLGARYVNMFLEQGAKSVAILDVMEVQGKALAESHNKTSPGKVIFIKCDMSKEEEIAKAFDEVVAKFKQVDVIINNAGIMVDAQGVWRTACDVNYQGVVDLTLKGINHMDKREGGAGGTIVNIASSAAITRFPFLPIYSGSKIAVLHFCRCITMDPFYANTGVRILCMCFGPTDTPLLHNLSKRVYNEKLGKEFEDSVVQMNVNYQKIESAMAGVNVMLKNGESGSVWLATDDRPVKDISSVLDQSFGLLEKEVYGLTD